jgi:nucleoside-diphosphate-sugar epimerase
MSAEIVVVAGAHGVTGRAAAEHWSSMPDTGVYGLERRSATMPPGVVPLVADLLNVADLQQKLRPIENVTHIDFGAFILKPTAAEMSEVNVAILRNLVDAVESTSTALKHVTFYQGGSAYGANLGPFKTPARENDARLMPPNFYYDQEDFLRQR